MNLNSCPNIEYWYRPRTSIKGFVSVRKEKIEFPNHEIRDILIIATEETATEEVSHSTVQEKKAPTKEPSKQEEIQVSKKKSEKIKNFDCDLLKKSKKIAKSTLENTVNQKTPVNDPVSDKKIPEFSIPSIKTTEVYAKKASNEEKNHLNNFKCPDHKCLLQFSTTTSFLEHISEFHALKCKMPYCTYSCFTFQDYFSHFQTVHCLVSIPKKRGPVTTAEQAKKEQKINLV